MDKSKFRWTQALLEQVDPLTWIRNQTSFKPFSYQDEILRDNSKSLRVIRKARQIGITTIIAYEAVWKALTRRGKVILIVSPSSRQSQIPMRRIQKILHNNPNLSTRITRRNRSELEFDTGSVIVSLPNNPDRLRGFSATDIYLDEAAHFMNDEPVMAAIRPMLIATRGTFTVVSTPFGKRGLFYDQYRNAVNQQNLNSDVKAYELYPSSISPRVTDAYLESERLNLTDMKFRQEYMGEFIEEVDTYFPLDLIQPCIDPSLEQLNCGEEGQKYYMGIDLAKQRDETVLIILDETEDGVFRVRHIDAWSHMNYSEQIGRITQLATKFKIKNAAADETGVGAAVIEDLKRVIPVTKGITFSVKTKTNLAAGTKILFEKKQIRIPNNKKLILQLNSLRYEVSKYGNTLFTSPDKERFHDDYLWALALACHAAKNSYAPLQLIVY